MKKLICQQLQTICFVMNFLFIPTIVNAEFLQFEFFQPLSKKDIILESVFVGFTCIDWMQTKKFIADKEDNLRESNPILGKEPTQERIDTLIFSAMISHAFVTYALPPEYRESWQMFFIFVEFNAVLSNHNNGVRISINLRILFKGK